MANQTTASPIKGAPKKKKAGSKAAHKMARTNARPTDAMKILKNAHKLLTLFNQYENLENDNEEQAIADKICFTLMIHAQIEEESIIPPLARLLMMMTSSTKPRSNMAARSS